MFQLAAWRTKHRRSFEALDAIDDDCRRGEKLGRWPRWAQNIECPACPRCAQPMPFVFQLDSRQGLPFMVGAANVVAGAALYAGEDCGNDGSSAVCSRWTRPSASRAWRTAG